MIWHMGILSVQCINAAFAPIAWATYAGRRYAEELDAAPKGDELAFRREITGLMSVGSLLP